MIGIVVVSHSHALADAALALALEMGGPNPPEVALAAGLDESRFGTDAAAVMAAVEKVDTPEGVLVIADLGSAVLSAEMALELLDPELSARVRITSAPFVEGLVSAVVTAAAGADLTTVAAEAERALAGKVEHLQGDSAGEPPARRLSVVTPNDREPDAEETILTVPNKQGLHARPAAAFVRLVGEAGQARARITNLDTHVGPVDGGSLSGVASLQARQGHRLRVLVSGDGAGELVAKLVEFQQNNFGDDDSAGTSPGTEPGSAGRVSGPLCPLTVDPDPDGAAQQRYRTGDVAAEEIRFAQAVEEARVGLADVVDLAARSVSEQAAEMVATQLVLLDDPAVLGPVGEAVQGGASALNAWMTHLAHLQAKFEAMPDEYLRERGQDVASLERRVRAALLDLDLPEPSGCSGVVLVDELDAPTAVLLPEPVTGVVTRRGGRSGHGVLVAAARRIPVVADVGDSLDHLSPGEHLELPG